MNALLDYYSTQYFSCSWITEGRNVREEVGQRAAVGAAEFRSAAEQMGETRQGRMNSGQKEGDSRAWPPTCPPHTSPRSYFKKSPLLSPQSSDHIRPGVHTPSHVIGRVWDGVREVGFAEVLIGNRGMLNIFRNMPVRDVWLRDAFNICTDLLCKHSVHHIFFSIWSNFFCSFLMKLAGLQTPESEICKAFLLLLSV